jgi:hypothetical protein
MSEFLPPRSRREKARYEGVKTVIAAMANRHNVEVFPAMSDHYRAPEPTNPQLRLVVNQPDNSFGYTDNVTQIFERLNMPDDVA